MIFTSELSRTTYYYQLLKLVLVKLIPIWPTQKSLSREIEKCRYNVIQSNGRLLLDIISVNVIILKWRFRIIQLGSFLLVMEQATFPAVTMLSSTGLFCKKGAKCHKTLKTCLFFERVHQGNSVLPRMIVALNGKYQ